MMLLRIKREDKQKDEMRRCDNGEDGRLGLDKIIDKV